MTLGRFEWERALRSSSLPWPTKAVCLLLATYMDSDDGSTFVSVTKLARAAGLARSGVLRHLGAAEAAGWLRATRTPGRPTVRHALDPSHQQDRYGVAPPVPPAGPVPSHQQDQSVPPAGPVPSHQQDPIKQLSLRDHDNNNGAREEVEVLVQPEDHEPRSEENLADRLRGTGVSWSDYEIREAMRKLEAVHGGGAGAVTPAASTLMALATRRKPIERLGAYLAKVQAEQGDEGLRSLRPAVRRPRPEKPAPVPWCGQCDSADYRFTTDENGLNPRRCPRCHTGAQAAA